MCPDRKTIETCRSQPRWACMNRDNSFAPLKQPPIASSLLVPLQPTVFLPRIPALQHPQPPHHPLVEAQPRQPAELERRSSPPPSVKLETPNPHRLTQTPNETEQQ